ncbi:uncharacterized protein LOC122795592 [Protopterus annectens]|uniref:uncharacterized protein LOC122795592 n=1 Tax=Protopterus annectens TaxID=7888 RepID=UPI001CFA975C|nr:uncharacterized protein LOC122795592 [Protopterus annectens]XP_043919783.1 uncharacterized protein LOC122795592 [Protopterus annectens]XP_043919785.1 uncharacterized protein LOC122795592 [Protopterus annectens]
MDNDIITVIFTGNGDSDSDLELLGTHESDTDEALIALESEVSTDYSKDSNASCTGLQQQQYQCSKNTKVHQPLVLSRKGRKMIKSKEKVKSLAISRQRRKIISCDEDLKPIAMPQHRIKIRDSNNDVNPQAVQYQENKIITSDEDVKTLVIPQQETEMLDSDNDLTPLAVQWQGCKMIDSGEDLKPLEMPQQEREMVNNAEDLKPLIIPWQKCKMIDNYEELKSEAIPPQESEMTASNEEVKPLGTPQQEAEMTDSDEGESLAIAQQETEMTDSDEEGKSLTIAQQESEMFDSDEDLKPFTIPWQGNELIHTDVGEEQKARHDQVKHLLNNKTGQSISQQPRCPLQKESMGLNSMESPHKNVTGCDGDWSSQFHPLHINEFREPIGPAVHLEEKCKELDFMDLMFPPALYDLLARETNRYSQQFQAEAKKCDTCWTPVTVCDIKAYLGIQIYMSIVKVPRCRMYWSKASLYGHFPIANVMTRDRYNKIHQYFHANDSSQNPPVGSENHDKLHHVRPVLDKVLNACRTQYYPHREVLVDAVMTGYKVHLQQYIPDMPQHCDLKVWTLADAHNGFIIDFQVQTGNDNNTLEMSLGENVVKDLTSNLCGKYHHVYFDHFFTSVHLATDLLKQGIYCCGSMRTEKSGWPACLTKVTTQEKSQGQYKQLQNGSLVATVWKDKKSILLLSTNHDPTSPLTYITRRQSNGTVLSLPCPAVVKQYETYKNRISIANQLWLQYPSIRRLSEKWLYLFWYLWDVAVANAYILYRENVNLVKQSKNGQIKTTSQLDFLMAVSEQLLFGYLKRKRCISVAKVTFAPDIEGLHFPVKTKKARCRNCALKRKRSEPSYMCGTCNVQLCIECFPEFHSCFVSPPRTFC